MAKYNVCTNFYSNYLYKGLALYNSLEKTSRDFCLWILCMDDETFNVLSSLKPKHANLIRLNSVETPELLKVKKLRNQGEYSWTLKSSFISYLFNNYPKIPSFFYLDGDIFLFNDIKNVYDDIGNKSIAIAPHRFPIYLESRTETAGIFNAGVVFIKRDPTGMKALESWRKQCIKWCYWRLEDGKLGDQMYLDEWPKLYKNLYQFQNPGINLAPWNVNIHKITKKGGGIYVGNQPLFFYHFHQLKIYSDLTFEPSYGYYISPSAINYIYKPYESTILKLIKRLDDISPCLKLNLEKKDKIQSSLLKIKLFLYSHYWKIKKYFAILFF